MRLTDRLRNLAATFATNLRARHNAAIAYAHTLPTRAKIAAAQSTSRLGDALVDVAAKLHEATTEAKRQQWRRRIQAWRQSVRIEELMLGDLVKQGSYRVSVQGKGTEASIPSSRFHERIEEAAEKTGVSIAAIQHYMEDGKRRSPGN